MADRSAPRRKQTHAGFEAPAELEGPVLRPQGREPAPALQHGIALVAWPRCIAEEPSAIDPAKLGLHDANRLSVQLLELLERSQIGLVDSGMASGAPFTLEDVLADDRLVAKAQAPLREGAFERGVGTAAQAGVRRGVARQMGCE